jgi:hypothetical protein
MGRIFDLLALAALAFLVLLPKPSVIAHPAWPRVDAEARTRIAELEAARLLAPGDTALALELAELYERGRRPEWALQTLSPLAAAHPDDHRLWFGIAVAHADRFEFELSRVAINRTLEACGRDPRCDQPARARLALFERAMSRIAAEKLDMEHTPHKVREVILESLRNTKIPPPGGKQP